MRLVRRIESTPGTLSVQTWSRGIKGVGYERHQSMGEAVEDVPSNANACNGTAGPKLRTARAANFFAPMTEPNFSRTNVTNDCLAVAAASLSLIENVIPLPPVVAFRTVSA